MREVPTSAQYATKVRNLLDQYEKISKAVQESDSSRVQARAAREIQRLEQVLGDNIAELEQTNRSIEEQAQEERIGKDTLQEQWRRNDDLIQRSQQVWQELRTNREAQQKRQQAEAPQSKQEQAFIETGNFLKQGWSLGIQAEKAPQIEVPPSGEVRLDELTRGVPFKGLRGVIVAPPQAGVEISQPAAVDRTQGLKPLPEALAAGAAPGLEAPPEAKAARTYTFQRTGGDAELELSFTRYDAGRRLIALLLLLAVPVFFLVRARRRAA
jgi:hypothetical protein